MRKKERKDDSFIKKPVYPGGTSAYRKFIKENLKYPKEALKNKTEGTVFLKYTINHKGIVTETKVIKGIGDGCDEEAERIISMLKFEIPKGPRKLRVLFHQKTQITFRIPKQKAKAKPKPTPTSTSQKSNATPISHNRQLVYKYVPAKKDHKDKDKQKKTYTYTIRGKI